MQQGQSVFQRSGSADGEPCNSLESLKSIAPAGIVDIGANRCGLLECYRIAQKPYRNALSESLVHGSQQDVVDVHVFGSSQTPDDRLGHLLRLEGRVLRDPLLRRLCVAEAGHQEELRLHETGRYQGHLERDLALPRLQVTESRVLRT